MSALSESISEEPGDAAGQYSCALTAVLLRKLHELGGELAVESVLRKARCRRTLEYLQEPSNWITFDESVALWEAATHVTHQRSLARSVGASAASSLRNGPAGESLRSANTAEQALARLAEQSARFNRCVTISVQECRPGLVEIVHRAVEGLPRSTHHCDGALGLLEQAVALAELADARIEHDTCAALGAPECSYRITWRPSVAGAEPEPSHAVGRLRAELDAMRERLYGMFDTAADLVGTGLIDQSLQRIAARAAREFGASRCLLAVRAGEDEEPQLHSHGFEPEQLQRLLERLRAGQQPDDEPSFLSVPIRSGKHDYGFLLVERTPHAEPRSEDRELLEVYARYAVIALDGASARLRAEQRFEQTTALLEFAREVSAAGTSAEVAQRLADSVGLVLDCDEVGVHRCEGESFTLLGYRDYRGTRSAPPPVPLNWTPRTGEVAARFVRDPELAPIFLSLRDATGPDRRYLVGLGLEGAIVVPLAGIGGLLGLLLITARDRPERLRQTAELTAQLEGVVAQATTTLENGHLIDVIVHRSRHDQLTGLPNRVKFSDDLQAAIARARADGTMVGLFYMDLDRFKPVNDGFGHDTGDELLVAVAARLRSHAREPTRVARLGGDEFAVVADAASSAELELIAQEIRALFDEPFQAGGRSLPLSVSIGRSVFPTDAVDEHDLVRIADQAMYADKHAVPGSQAGDPQVG